VQAALFLCQAIYWRGKESSGNGWLYKSSEELTTETGLSYRQQKAARAKLRKAGVLDEKYRRLNHMMYFRIDLDALARKWEEFLDASKLAEFPNAPNVPSRAAETAIPSMLQNTSREVKRRKSVAVSSSRRTEEQKPGRRPFPQLPATLSAVPGLRVAWYCWLTESADSGRHVDAERAQRAINDMLKMYDPVAALQLAIDQGYALPLER